MLSDLIEKGKDYRNNESTFEKESNVESSSDREEEGEEIASVNGSKDEDTQESDNDTENDRKKETGARRCSKVVLHDFTCNIIHQFERGKRHGSICTAS